MADTSIVYEVGGCARSDCDQSAEGPIGWFCARHEAARREQYGLFPQPFALQDLSAARVPMNLVVAKAGQTGAHPAGKVRAPSPRPPVGQHASHHRIRAAMAAIAMTIGVGVVLL